MSKTSLTPQQKQGISSFLSLTPLQQKVYFYFSEHVEQYALEDDVVGIPLYFISNGLNMSVVQTLGIIGSLVRKGVLFTHKCTSGTTLVGYADAKGLLLGDEVFDPKKEEGNCSNNSCKHECNFSGEYSDTFSTIMDNIVDINEDIIHLLVHSTPEERNAIESYCGGIPVKAFIEDSKDMILLAKSSLEEIKDPQNELLLSYAVLDSLKTLIDRCSEDKKDCCAPSSKDETKEIHLEEIKQEPVKTEEDIHLSEEELESLRTLAKTLRTQDTEGTKNPVWYLLQEKVKRYDPFNPKTFSYYDSVLEAEYVGDSVEDILSQVLKDRDLTEESCELHKQDIKDNNTSAAAEIFMEAYEDEVEATIESLGDIIEREAQGITYVYETKETFLTRGSAERHLRQNNYHYNEPRIYVQHAWRNPEAELVRKLLLSLS